MTDVPESLRAKIMDAVMGGRADGRMGGTVAEQLQRAGEGLMLEAKFGTPNRDSAMTLLAADALITFAQEALAELEPERLAEMR